MKQRLTDRYGKTIGWTDDQGDRIWLTDEYGRQLGYYSYSYDATFTATGQRIGNGNILGTLL
jgi:hypothetical protein